MPDKKINRYIPYIDSYRSLLERQQTLPYQKSLNPSRFKANAHSLGIWFEGWCEPNQLTISDLKKRIS